MNRQEQDIFLTMRAVYPELTASERAIADFFFNERPKEGLLQKEIADRVYVSQASLSRFAQRCGFSGFREFIFVYKKTLMRQDAQFSGPVCEVLGEYQALYAKTLRLIDEAQFARIIGMMKSSRQIHIYGYGQSGYTAHAIKARFMRLGLSSEVFTEDFAMMIDSTLDHSGGMVIGLSVSGKTKCVLQGMRQAKENGAKTVLITASSSKKLLRENDCLLQIADHDDFSQDVSTFPQYPLMLMVDLLFAHYLHTDIERNTSIYHTTHLALGHNYDRN